MWRFFFSFIYALLVFLLIPFYSRLSAQEYKSDYSVEYFIKEDQTSLKTHVLFTIKTTNMKSDVYVKKFTLSFPNNFLVSNLKARDDRGTVEPQLTQSEDKTNIELEFNDPKIGKNSENTFILEFDQNNLFVVNGAIWEVILPTIEKRGEGTYQVIVNLPNTNKKISISKPKPEKIERNRIYWTNPNSKTIYAVFGDNQLYQMDLIYNLSNEQITSAAYNVAFPPDTTHQKIFVESINPQPNSVYIDEDGNYIGRYILRPKESKKIIFKGYAQLFIQPRDDARQINLSKIKRQEKYLLTEVNYWKVSQPERFASLKSIQDIYNFIVSNFKYNFNRVSATNSFGRLGAENALKKPDQAICVEFTDTFIALAREKGIKSREIQGYAFSQDSRLRPLSLLRDVLHSWPEYYDEEFQDWIQVDPTWGNTSGIDYFTSFDLNHIAFAIHGKDPVNPLPAGMYKVENSKDVTVQTSATVPKEMRKAKILKVDVDRKLDDTKLHEAKVVIKNEGNVFLNNVPITFIGENIQTNPQTFLIDSIAPYEEKTVEFEVRAQSGNRYKKALLSVILGDFDKKKVEISISPYSFKVGLWIAGIILTVFGSLLFFFLKAKKRKKVAKV